jgi:hypothetical protein
MTGKAQGGDDLLSKGAAVQARAGDPGLLPVSPELSGSFVRLRDRRAPAASGARPHFLGALLIASSAGLIGCLVSLLLGQSLWESLAVYSLSGGIIFVGLLMFRSGPDDPKS